MPVNKSGINLFNFMMKHSHVPSQFGLSIIVLLVKDKNGDICSSDNCRGNTIDSLMFSVLWPSLSIFCTLINFRWDLRNIFFNVFA